MADIAIQTQPSNTTVQEFGTATFTVVLSGSAADTTSYLTSSKQWYLSSSWAAVAGATDLTLTLTNVQDTQDGNKYIFTAHSASAAGTKVTSSAAYLVVVDPDIAWSGVDQAATQDATYSSLGHVGFGYKWFIPLMVSGSELSEVLCPHFVSKQDLREFINRQTSLTQEPVVAAANAATWVYNTVEIAETVITGYDGLGQTGYKYWIPLFLSGSQIVERQCPHFVTEHDCKTFIDKVVEAGTLTVIIGE